MSFLRSEGETDQMLPQTAMELDFKLSQLFIQDQYIGWELCFWGTWEFPDGDSINLFYGYFGDFDGDFLDYKVYDHDEEKEISAKLKPTKDSRVSIQFI